MVAGAGGASINQLVWFRTAGRVPQQQGSELVGECWGSPRAPFRAVPRPPLVGWGDVVASFGSRPFGLGYRPTVPSFLGQVGWSQCVWVGQGVLLRSVTQPDQAG